MDNDLFPRIRNFEQKLSGKQKRLAQYLLSHFEEIPFQTVAEISSKAGVSDSTVIRFSRAFGCDGFPELKEKFQGAILEKLSPSERLHKVIDFPNNFKDLVSLVFEREVQNLKETEKRLEIENIEKIAKCIIKARGKYVTGLRASSGCAHLLGRFLTQILPNVVTILDGDSRLFEGIRDIGKKDVLVAISYSRYTKTTIEALQFARDRKASTVTITDSKLSPAAQLSKFTLIAPANSYNFANSYTGCISIINLLVTLIIHMEKDQAEMNLRAREEALQGLHLHYGNEVPSISLIRGVKKDN
jgi:DNA-binding MurR/RpiR family transcriptional regulator